MENKIIESEGFVIKKNKYCIFKIDKFLQDHVSSQTRL